MKLLEVKQEFNKILKSANIDDINHNINVILEYVTGLNYSQILLLEDISEDVYKKAYDLIAKRATGYPLQYIVGKVEFLGNTIKVNPSVLIPRNETEQLCEIISKKADNKSVLDLCTGSGCIGLGIKANSKAIVDLSDVSTDALKVAQHNAEINHLDVNIIKSNLFDNITKKYDIIVSNPPYLTSLDMTKLQKEVTYEPKLALYGSEDGLDFYRKIIEDCVQYLNPNGEIYFEYGMGQAQDIAKLLKKDFECITIIKDYYNIERFIYAKLKENIC